MTYENMAAVEAALAQEYGSFADATHTKCDCERCNSGLPHTPTLEEFQALQAANWALEAQITEHDKARANLFHQQETLHATEWRQATDRIESLEAEVRRVTALGAQWAQEREDAREQLGREMTTVDDMTRDVARLEGQLIARHGTLDNFRAIIGRVQALRDEAAADGILTVDLQDLTVALSGVGGVL